MNEREALKYVLDECSERMITFFNTHQLPDLPDFLGELEDIMINMPSVQDGNYGKYQNAAISLMLKMTLDWVSTQDGDALRAAFNALTSINIDGDKAKEMNTLLDNAENEEVVEEPTAPSQDNIIDIAGDEEEDI